jgi:3-phosphoshikimate 1-carboxyvinyltransferase
MSSRRFAPPGPLRGGLRPPPDKSISHRAAILAAMGEGEASVRGYLDAADTRSTLAAVAALGAEISEGDPSHDAPGGIDVRIAGVGLRGAKPVERIDVGNAGTLIRILPGWLVGQPEGSWVLDGDESIRSRPVDRIAEPLATMGAAVSCREDRWPPLRIEGDRLLVGQRHELRIASAQVKSCLLLAGILAEGATTVVEPAPTRDHTERMLRAAGARVRARDLRTVPGIGGPPAREISVEPVDRLELSAVEVPGDFSSAAFWLLAATIVPDSEVRISGVGLNPTRVGFLGILNRMGAAVRVVEEELGPGGEPRGAVLAAYGDLVGTRIHAEEVAIAIDELPLVALAGCFAQGETVVEGAAELRRKESDRIAGVVDGLGSLGAEIEARDDGFVVNGTGGLDGGRLDARGDHRMAMLGAIAGLASRSGVDVDRFDSVAVSYPGFEADLARLIR